jgi:Fungal specific transcription factor domain
MVAFNKNMIDNYGSFFIPLALQNPMLLYAVLSRTAMEFQGRALPSPGNGMNSGTVVNKGKTNYEFLHFKHEAIRHLNEQLRNPNLGGVNSTTLYTIIFMLRLEASLNFLVPSRRSLISSMST